MDNRKISNFISQKRKEKNLTQQQVADILNVTPKAVSKWETAKGLPDIATVPDLCSVLGISATEFFAGENINVESPITKNDLIINVAKNYNEMGKKQTVCFYTFVICLIFLIVASFFGDGTAKLIAIVFACAVSGISVYKLASINLPDIKKLQIIALISLICITLVSVSLGTNYFQAKNTGEIITTTHIAKLIFGDYSYTLQKFLIGFKNAVSACALVSGQNFYLLSAYLKNK